MNTFRYQRELDVPFLQQKFGNDIFSAREIIGSFVEMVEGELGILEAALQHKDYKDYARVALRMKNGFNILGLKQEKKALDDMRAHLAAYGANERFIQLATEFLEMVENKRTLFKIELHRLDNWLEQAANGQ
ncbi:MAG: hypothetical protein HKN45_12400 [Flavobacteriales bacterium]|nr:hypothetical protein [Flavobacteriales bacterium]NNK80618.1 hypothetical protein [Flavobacteriales bacterium]